MRATQGEGECNKKGYHSYLIPASTLHPAPVALYFYMCDSDAARRMTGDQMHSTPAAADPATGCVV